MNIIADLINTFADARNIFLPLFEKTPLEHEVVFQYLPTEVQKILLTFHKKEFRGKEHEVKTLWLPHGTPQKIILLGLGDRTKWQERKYQLVARRIVHYAKQEKIQEFATSLRDEFGKTSEDAARVFATNAHMADFEFNKYKETPKEGWPEIKTITLFCEERNIRKLQHGIEEGEIIGKEVNACRMLANTPGGDMTPIKLADAAVALAKETGIRATILNEQEIEKLGMGGILGVARGSSEKPRFIILEYKHGARGEKPIVLAGKGVTFDTGGLNLKPDDAIYEMHLDMSGGAAVMHGMAAAARLKLPINIVGLIPAVENMPSGSSYHPGDLLKSFSGKTIEVLNTDAEGRVILADALAFGARRFRPQCMLDFATLTGAAHVALGNYFSALFTQDAHLQELLINIGKTSGDYVWPLPLWDEYLDEIKGTFGDLANVGKKDRHGGAIHGAKFLEQFTGGARWAHVDIAPRMTTIEGEYLAKGASGVGVRFIATLAKEYAQLYEL